MSASVARSQEVFVPNYGDGTVTAIDLGSGSTVPIHIPGPGCDLSSTGAAACPEGVAVAGGKAFVALDNSVQCSPVTPFTCYSRVAVIDIGTHTVKPVQIDINPRFDVLIKARPGGDRAYVTGCGDFHFDPLHPDAARYHSIEVIDVSTEARLTGITLPPELSPAGTWGITFSPSGNWAYVGNCGGAIKGVHRLNLVTNAWDSFIPTANHVVVDLAVSPDGSVLYGTVGDGCLTIIDLTLGTEASSSPFCPAGGELSTALGVEFHAAATNRAYVADFDLGLVPLDVTNPKNPLVLPAASVTAPGGGASSVRLSGSYAYLTMPEAEYGDLPTHVVVFNLSGTTPTQVACATNTAGLGGFVLDVLGTGAPVCDGPPADVTPPQIGSISASTATLWPPNHKLVPITVTVSVTDDLDPAPVCEITNVSSDQPSNGRGDGNTGSDWQITGPLTVLLRSERQGGQPARRYLITVVCTDAAENTATGSVPVLVRHDRRR